MKDRRENLQADASEVLTETAESKSQEWNPPTLTTWKIEQETLADMSM